MNRDYDHQPIHSPRSSGLKASPDNSASLADARRLRQTRLARGTKHQRLEFIACLQVFSRVSKRWRKPDQAKQGIHVVRAPQQWMIEFSEPK